MSPPKEPPRPLPGAPSPAAGPVPHPPRQRLGPAGPLVAQSVPDGPALSRLSSAPTYPLWGPLRSAGAPRAAALPCWARASPAPLRSAGVQPRTGHRADPVRCDLPPKERKHSLGYSPRPRKRPGKRPEAAGAATAAGLGAGPGLLLMLHNTGGLGGTRVWAPGGDGRGCSPREGRSSGWDKKLRV